MPKHYLAREDSFLLAEQVKKYAKGDCLDMGTGSAIQALAAEKKASKIVASDIDKRLINFCKKNIKNKKIKFIHSDLFKKIKGKFDTIIFNPPYLPELKGESKELSARISGGKKGYELLEKFLNQASDYLKQNGKILIVFSSLTNKKKVDEIIKNNLFESRLLSTKKLFFENLYVYLIKKSKILKELEKKVNNIQFLTKGKRGLIYTANYKKIKVKKIRIFKHREQNVLVHSKTLKVFEASKSRGLFEVIIKLQRKDIAAAGTVKREAKFLKLLNKHKIGPKLIFAKGDYFIAEFIKGKLIKDFKKTKKILKNVINQCHILDKLKINKEEMHNPYKHIIINKKIVMIDFERAHYNPKVKNVTQFCQYIMHHAAVKDKNRLIKLSKAYKKSPARQNLNKIIAELK